MEYLEENKMTTGKDLKELLNNQDGPPQPFNPTMPQFMTPFPFTQFMQMPNQPTYASPVSAVNKSGDQSGTTMMWHTYTYKK